MRLLVLLFFIGTLIFPVQALAQNGEIASLPDYTLELKIDPQQHLLQGSLNMVLDTRFAEYGSIELLHNNGAVIEDIRTEPATQLNIQANDQGLRSISIPIEGVDAASITLYMVYSLKMPIDHPVNRITEEWIELNIDSFWLPLINGFPRFNYSMQLQLDDAYQVMTGDTLEINGDGSMTIESVLPRQDISFSAAKKIHTVEGDFVTVAALHSDTQIDSVKVLADQAMRFLSNYIDEPNDFVEKRKVVVSPREEVGYSRKNYIVLSDIRNRNAISLGGFLCHEFAHYWFSEANVNTKHHWLSESFAEYLSMIFIRETYGQQAFDDFIEEKQKRIENDPKPLADYEGRPSYLAMYVKGPLILHQFEVYVGKENFKLLINRFVDQTIATNEELFALIESLFGKEAVVELERLRATI